MSSNSFVVKQKVPTMKEVMNNQEDILTRTIGISMSLSLATYNCHDRHMNRVAMLTKQTSSLSSGAQTSFLLLRLKQLLLLLSELSAIEINASTSLFLHEAN